MKQYILVFKYTPVHETYYVKHIDGISMYTHGTQDKSKALVVGTDVAARISRRHSDKVRIIPYTPRPTELKLTEQGGCTIEFAILGNSMRVQLDGHELYLEADQIEKLKLFMKEI